jgi:hypothetical protein
MFLDWIENEYAPSVAPHTVTFKYTKEEDYIF